MTIYETNLFYVGIAMLFAVGSMSHYVYRRSVSADEETRSALSLLYIIAGAFFVYGLSMMWISLATSIGIYYPLIIPRLMMIIEAIVIAGAALKIVNARMSYYVGVGAFVLVLLLTVFIPSLYPTLPGIIQLQEVMLMMLLLGESLLFGYIARATRRPTSLSIAAALIVQLAHVYLLYHIVWSDVIIVLMFFVLMGPAMIFFAFARPEMNLSLEIIGYGAAYAAPAVVLAMVQTQLTGTDVSSALLIATGAAGAAMGAGTSAFLYGRWKESKAIPTALLTIGTSTTAVSQLVGLIAPRGYVTFVNALYIDYVMGLILGVTFSATAILAAGWKNVVLLPVLVAVPAMMVLLFSYPLNPLDNPLVLLSFGAGIMFLLLIPAAIFGMVYIRARREGGAALRALGLSIGLLIMLTVKSLYSLFPEMLGTDLVYAIQAAAIALFWLGLTGRLDRLLTKKQD